MFYLAISSMKRLISLRRKPVFERSKDRNFWCDLTYLMMAGFICVEYWTPRKDISLFVFFLRWNSRTTGDIYSLILRFRSSSWSIAIISVIDRKLIRLYFSLQTLMFTCRAIHKCIIFFFEMIELEISISVIAWLLARRGTRALIFLVLLFWRRSKIFSFLCF